MRKLCGTVLALAGVSVGAYALWSGKTNGGSPPRTTADAGLHVAKPSGQTPVEDAPATVLEISDAAPWVVYPPSSTLPLDRVRLTREIQARLKRVGCYDGAIDGVWSASVRRSMKTFTDRLNATLPVEEPDVVLLAMLQSHQEGGCGVPCPPGQGAAVADRCLPNGLVAKAAEKPMSASAIPAATTSLSVGENSPVGQPFSKDDRMSLAGPIPPVTPEPPGKTVRRPPSPPASVSPSGRFPGWAARAFESW